MKNSLKSSKFRKKMIYQGVNNNKINLKWCYNIILSLLYYNRCSYYSYLQYYRGNFLTSRANGLTQKLRHPYNIKTKYLDANIRRLSVKLKNFKKNCQKKFSLEIFWHAPFRLLSQNTSKNVFFCIKTYKMT